MKLTELIVTTAALLTACGGVEEIALNPQGTAAGSAALGGYGGSLTAAAGGNTSDNPTAGTINSGGTPSSTQHGGSAGQPPMLPAQGGTGPVGCITDAACQSLAAPHCRSDGLCVACLVDDDCPGEEPTCEALSGSCTNVDCGSAGNDAGGNCP